jgi:hypothetical protein
MVSGASKKASKKHAVEKKEAQKEKVGEDAWRLTAKHVPPDGFSNTCVCSG